MKIAVLGTGMVGNVIATKLIQLGHQVMMGSRNADNEKSSAWIKQNGSNASQGTFADAASFGEIIFNCTNGSGTLDALKSASEKNLEGKIIIDISNPLDFSKGMPPTLLVANTDSLGEQVQRAFPNSKVVKTLNTINCNVMVNPSLIPGEHDVFLSGNDADAKAKVKDILVNWFGWKNVLDLGDISGARSMEMYVILWVRMMAGPVGNPNFNIHIQKAGLLA
jgi:predicted dinucleotide-binding enzyme